MIASQLLEFKQIVKSRSAPSLRKPDKQTRRLLLYLFTGTRGGFTRLNIISHLMEGAYNTHQLAVKLGLDYKAIQHHMLVLEKNNLVRKAGDKYGALYQLTDFLELNILALDEAIEKLDRKMNQKKVYI